MQPLLFKFLSVTVAALLLASPVLAADPVKTPPAIAIVVDVQRVLDESEAAKGVQKYLNGQRSQFQADTEKEENQLRSSEQELTKARDHLSADAYGEREQQLRQHFLAVERHVEARRKTLDQTFTDSMNIVRDNLIKIVERVAREKGANLVLVKQQVLWMDKPLDVTNEVLAELNKTLPKVTIKPLSPESVDMDKAK